MSERQPKSAENIANRYDDDTMQHADANAVISWPEARHRLADGRLFWWATTRPGGAPHIRPVFAVLIGGVLYSTTNANASKARNLAADPRFACSVSTDEIDFIVEGRATPVTDPAVLGEIVDAYRTKYGPLTLRDGAFYAPFGAPTAGPPPDQPYALTPDVILGLRTTQTYAMRSTRWRF